MERSGGNGVAILLIALLPLLIGAFLAAPLEICPACDGHPPVFVPPPPNPNSSYAALGFRCYCVGGRVSILRRWKWNPEPAMVSAVSPVCGGIRLRVKPPMRKSSPSTP